MASDDLDVDAGGMVGKEKRNPIAVTGRKRRGEGRSADGSDLVDGPVDNGAEDSLVEAATCVQFACSPRVSVDFLLVLRLPPTNQKCA
eukprot:g22365.t1